MQLICFLFGISLGTKNDAKLNVSRSDNFCIFISPILLSDLWTFCIGNVVNIAQNVSQCFLVGFVGFIRIQTFIGFSKTFVQKWSFWAGKSSTSEHMLKIARLAKHDRTPLSLANCDKNTMIFDYTQDLERKWKREVHKKWFSALKIVLRVPHGAFQFASFWRIKQLKLCNTKKPESYEFNEFMQIAVAAEIFFLSDCQDFIKLTFKAQKMHSAPLQLWFCSVRKDRRNVSKCHKT